MRFLLSLFVFLIASFSLEAQVSFTASADAKEIVKGGYLEVTFTLANANGAQFKPPSFKNFKVAGGPSTSRNSSWINGKATSSTGYTYTLLADKIGTKTIGPASIKVGNKTLNTRPLQVKVVKGRKVASGATVNIEDQVFIRAEPSVNEARIGQQILLDYKLYTQINIESYNITSEPEYDGFYAQNISRFDGKIVKEVINGVQYSTKILRRVALYPQQAGLMTINPMSSRLGIVDETKPKQRRSFFFNRNLKQFNINTQTVQINVKPLPGNAPPTFSGAVGNYGMQVQMDKNKLTTDDAITLQVTITGNGDIKRLQPPKLELDDNLEVYEPNILDEKEVEQQGQNYGQKILEYLILPKEPGRYQIAPEFTFFDTDSLAYRTLRPRVFNVFVSKGTGKSKVQSDLAENDKLNGDIKFIKTDSNLSKAGSYFYGSPFFWVLFSLPMFLLGGVVVKKQLDANKPEIDQTLLKSQQAQKHAEEKLATAKKYLSENKGKPFYDEVSRAMFGYVGDKLNMPPSEFSKQNIAEKLDSLNVNQDHISKFTEIVKTAEMALFAGMDNNASMSKVYADALDMVAKIEGEIIS